jgi:hypothetical protein
MDFCAEDTSSIISATSLLVFTASLPRIVLSFCIATYTRTSELVGKYVPWVIHRNERKTGECNKPVSLFTETSGRDENYSYSI